MFWFDKTNEDAVFMDRRNFAEKLSDGRTLEVRPDIVGDFRSMPFEDESFYLVVFDPPHLIKAGDKSWLAKKYGKLDDTCQRILSKDFRSVCESLNLMEHLYLSGMRIKYHCERF